MPVGEGDPVAQIDHPLPRGQALGDLVGACHGGRGEVDGCGARGVGGAHVGVVGGDVVETGQQVGDEGVGVARERRVGRLLLADRGGGAVSRAGGAEAAEAVGGQHLRLVREFGREPVDGRVLGAGQVRGEAGFDQVGAADGADEQRTAGEHRDGGTVFFEDVRGVVRGVSGRGQCTQGQGVLCGEDHDVPVVDGGVADGDPGGGRDEVGGTGETGQFRAAGDVVVVDVGLDDVGYPHVAPGRRRDHPVHVARRVDGHRRPFTARQIAAVAESCHLDGVDEEHASTPFPVELAGRTSGRDPRDENYPPGVCVGD